ncbi:MAG: TraB/GumN family protein [Nitrospiraceae bacterium]|nr:MAG: TraB/GumN family protein [Nitrospiraceae bacterium]
MLHKNKLLFLTSVLLTLLFITSAFAESKNGKSFIWTFESGNNTVYLLGSIHVLNRESYPLPEEIEQIYSCCSKVVFETDLDSMDDSSLQAKMLRRGMYPRGRSLSGNVSADTYALLKRRLEASGLSIVQFEHFRPWMVALTLTGTEMIRLGFDPELGVDRRFFKKAKQDKKDLIFLETNEFQISLFAGLSRTRQEALLKQILIEIKIIESMFADMVHAWKNGDADKLDSIMNESFTEFPDLYDRLIVKRNRRWVSKILHHARQNGDLLVVVGAAHLVGEKSVVDLLRQKGYKVVQKQGISQ